MGLEKKFNFTYQTEDIKPILNKVPGIYKITSPTGRVYIGKSKNMWVRYCSYRRCCTKNQKHLQRSLVKYTPEKHLFEVIEFVEEEYLNEREIYWIAFYKSNKSRFPKKRGLNLTDGGEGTVGFKQSDYAKLRTSETMKGRKVSLETRLRQSQALKGKNKGKRTWLGKTHTNESKLKISLAKLGKRSGGEINTAKKVICTATGKIFDCIKHASDFFSIKPGSLYSYLNPNSGRINPTTLVYYYG